MKFGINLLNYGPGTTPDSLRRWAQFAEAIGYHFIMISDHVALTPDVQADYPAPFYDPFVSLAWLAGETDRIELGTTVAIIPYRHPLQTARLAANLDQLSGGRFILGVGVGWARQEFEALGVPFTQRGAIADEYLDVITRFLNGDVVSYQGHYVSFSEVHTGPQPARAKGLPIWVGGSSEPALKRAVRFGHAWHPYRPRLDWLRDVAMPRLRHIAESQGRSVPALCPRLTLALTDTPMPEATRVPGQGTEDQIRGDLEALASMGAQSVLLDAFDSDPERTLHPHKDWKMYAMLADRVLDLANEGLR